MSITKVFVKFGVMEPIVWPSTYCVKNWNKPPNKPLNKPLKLRFRLRPDALTSAKFFCLDLASFLGKCPPQWRGVKGSARHAQAFFCAFYGPFNIAVLFILSKAHHSWGSGWGPFGPPNTPRQMPNGSSARRRGAGGEMVHDLYWFYTWD